jgi:hypothetical protein
MLLTMLGFCRAESIHLKNGTMITADKVTEKDGQVDNRRHQILRPQVIGQQRRAPLHYLEGSFIRFSPAQASLAYAESLAATEYLRSTYGMASVRRMLDLLSEGETPEVA